MPSDGPPRQPAFTMAALMYLAALAGFQGTVTTQAMTFVADEFGANPSTQSIALALIRLDFVVAAVVVRWFDRPERKLQVLVASAIIGAALSVACGFSPSLAFFVTCQIFARGFATALALIVAIIAAESASFGERGRVSAWLIAAAGVGSGLTLAVLPYADSSTNGWRWMYWILMVAIPPAAFASRTAARGALNTTPILPSSAEKLNPHIRGSDAFRFVVGVFLISAFLNPSTQLLNEFLRTERFFAARDIALFILVANFFGAASLFLFRRFSDSSGRRVALTIGLTMYAVTIVAAYNVSGAAMWIAAAMASFGASIALPVLPLMPSENSDGDSRGNRSGAFVASSRLGGMAGLGLTSLLLVGSGLGASIAILAVAGIAGMGLLRRLPETNKTVLRTGRN